MPSILIRNIDAGSLRRLKDLAKSRGRSLQSEARMALERAAGADQERVAEMIEQWKKEFGGRNIRGTVEDIREDRHR